MDRFKERKKEFTNALERLMEALKEEETEIVIDGVLHRFEFTFELAWKSMKDYLEYMGVINKVGSPREIIKSAFEYELIDKGGEWIKMMLACNTLSHLYDEATSREIYYDIKNEYINLLSDLNKKFEDKI